MIYEALLVAVGGAGLVLMYPPHVWARTFRTLWLSRLWAGHYAGRMAGYAGRRPRAVLVPYRGAYLAARPAGRYRPRHRDRSRLGVPHAPAILTR